jgi:hypothetical protein
MFFRRAGAIRCRPFCFGATLALTRHFQFIHELRELVALPLAHVKKSDADGIAVVNDLHHATQPEAQAFDAEFHLDPSVDSNREWLSATDAAATQAQIGEAPFDARGHFDQQDGRRVIYRVARVLPALWWRGIGRKVLVCPYVAHDHALLRLLSGHVHYGLVPAIQFPGAPRRRLCGFASLQPIVLICIARGAERLVV